MVQCQNVLVARTVLIVRTTKEIKLCYVYNTILLYADGVTIYVHNKCIRNCGRLWMDYGTTVTNFLNYFVTLYL